MGSCLGMGSRFGAAKRPKTKMPWSRAVEARAARKYAREGGRPGARTMFQIVLLPSITCSLRLWEGRTERYADDARPLETIEDPDDPSVGDVAIRLDDRA